MAKVMRAPMKRATTSGPARWRKEPPRSSCDCGDTSHSSVDRIGVFEEHHGAGWPPLSPVADHHVARAKAGEDVVELAAGQAGRVATIEADAEVLPEHLALERERVPAHAVGE